MDKNKEIEGLLRKLCRWAKNNCNGGGVFQEDVDKMVPLVRGRIMRVINDNEKASISEADKTKKNRP
jgi:hypothetical protein